MTWPRSGDSRPGTPEPSLGPPARWVPSIVVVVAAVVGLVYVLGGDAPHTLIDEPTAPTSATTASPATPVAGDARDVWSRALDHRTLNLLRIGLVLFGAFAIGGLVQRVTLGEYGFKTPILELPARAATKNDVGQLATDLRKELDDLRGEVGRALSNAAPGQIVLELDSIVKDLIATVGDLADRVESGPDG